uniref:nucleotidyl transferase AbiEii/AbiGii toxin family protein n=1 Tax=Tardiphaga sp. TaxID=1926292 RepID=UPI00352B436C
RRVTSRWKTRVTSQWKSTAEEVFALKGGTAINLFEWDLPRLSVDIDLTYLPVEDRTRSLRAIGEALARIKSEIERRLPPTRVTMTRQGQEGMEIKLNCQRDKTQIKVEVNPTLRGQLLPLRDLPSSDRVQERFEAFVEARCISHGELFGGKICAVLDRQHPRDLFDVRRLLEGRASQRRFVTGSSRLWSVTAVRSRSFSARGARTRTQH